jgi:hypothetical protein
MIINIVVVSVLKMIRQIVEKKLTKVNDSMKNKKK